MVMDKIVRSLIISFVALLGFSACHNGDDPEPTVTRNHRTVLVYMVADNSLGTMGCDRRDIREMLKAVSAGGLNGGRLIVYHGQPSTAENPPELIDITTEGEVSLKTYPVTTDDGTTIYSVDPSRIKEVISDMKTVAAADEYAVVFWSHSNGWLGPTTPGDNRYRSFGDDRGHHITIPTLAVTLAGEKFAFIYFDCCQMVNVESMYELRDLAPFIVGSPTELGIEGMRYDLNIPVFFAAEPDLELAARNTFTDYSDNGLECQMTVVRTEGLDRLASATREIFAAVTEYPEDISSLQRYCRPNERCWSYDMNDYMKLLTAGTAPELYAEWKKAFDAVVTYAESTPRAISSSSYPLHITSYCGMGSHVIASPADISYRCYDEMAWWREVVSVCPAYK